MMNTIYFDNLDSYNDFNLLLLKKTIGGAKVKTDTVEVPGSSVSLDFTEFFGDVQYETRKLKFDFGTYENLEDVFSMVQNALNGQKMKIRLSEDPDWYYIGRISVNDWSLDKIFGKFTIEVECEPFKYKNNITSIATAVTGSKTIDFQNSRMWVVPSVKTTAPIKVKFGTLTFNIDKDGTYTIPEFQFKEGTNKVTFEGNATVTVEYQEGSL